ncbi:MAG: helix-turn-helix domain-containing protein [Acidobacteria bacterium]|nr:MAG: helix-turn-helix domain-containing protein [Acidobacteriota bacterium]REK09300.1 MAG: helix-turn-helix domain-containing protein [Acidobacteriota bacterium]
MNVVKDLRDRCALTQRELAEKARTSQPTIAAYESGAKSPNLRTLERMARAVGLEAAVEFVPPLTREDRRSLALHRAIAEKLQTQPQPTLERARRNLERMASNNPGATEILARWRGLLAGPLSQILEVLRDPRPSARELRHVTPFAGVLSAPERAEVYRRFAAAERGEER